MSEGNPTYRVGGDGWRLDTAPGFVLPGSSGGTPEVYRLEDYTDEGCVLLGFYPSERLDDGSFLSWFEFVEDIDAFVISDVDGIADTERTPPADLGIPVLGDHDGTVATQYGTDYETDSAGTIVLVDSEKRIRGTWNDDIDATDVYATARKHMNDTHTEHAGAE